MAGAWDSSREEVKYMQQSNDTDVIVISSDLHDE